MNLDDKITHLKTYINLLHPVYSRMFPGVERVTPLLAERYLRYTAAGDVQASGATNHGQAEELVMSETLTSNSNSF